VGENVNVNHSKPSENMNLPWKRKKTLGFLLYMLRFRSSAQTANPDIPSSQCLLMYNLLLAAMGHKGIIAILFTVHEPAWYSASSLANSEMANSKLATAVAS
jgi:hypothetical protein